MTSFDNDEWAKTNAALPSMRCVCGHWDTEHAAFVSRVRPGRTRTFCDHCACRSWMTPDDERAMHAARSRATDAEIDAELARRDDRIDGGLGTGYIGEFDR